MPENDNLAAEMVQATKRLVAATVKALTGRVESIERAVAAIPAGPRGEIGADGARGEKGDVGEIGPAGQAGASGPVGECGADGKDFDPAALQVAVSQVVAALPRPKDGADGKSLTADDMLPSFEAAFSKWALEVERRAVDQFQAAINRIPAPKDGRDGTDGLGFEDLAVEYDGERAFLLKFVRGEQVKEFRFSLPIVIDRGVFRAGETYARGDSVTWDGSTWIAQCDATDKPGHSDQWRLAVKRGQNGKDGRTPAAPAAREPVRVQ